MNASECVVNGKFQAPHIKFKQSKGKVLVMEQKSDDSRLKNASSASLSLFN